MLGGWEVLTKEGNNIEDQKACAPDCSARAVPPRGPGLTAWPAASACGESALSTWESQVTSTAGPRHPWVFGPCGRWECFLPR